MEKYVRKLTLFCCLFIISSVTLAEEVRYVTDSLIITMRTGQGTSHKIIKSLRSGSELTLLETDEEQGYSRVQTREGLEGWVLSRYLINDPIAKTKLKRAESEIKTLKARLARMDQDLSSTKSSSATWKKDSTKLAKDNEKLTKELANIKEIAANQIALNEENRELKEQVLTLKRDMQTMQQDNLTLQDRSARDWFMIGAGVLLIGVVMGLIVPNLRLKRRQTWSSL